jgi:signal transduction histidine kinase
LPAIGQNRSMVTAAAPLAPPLRSETVRFLRRGGVTLAIAAVVSLAVGVASGRPWAGSVYGICIAVSCWLCIDGGRLVVATLLHRAGAAPSPQWPGWGWMAAVIALGTLGGYSLGIALGNLVSGGQSPALWSATPRQALAMLMATAVPGIAATYIFWMRGRAATSAALAERAQRESAESQLRLLQAQLEPHMLFNTLANLRVLIGLDPPRAQAMLDALIAFLRATLAASRSERHALSAEFARCADYLALMQVRMGDRLVVHLDLPAGLAALEVPTLLLQPLVENAILHGLEPQVAGGRIEVRAARDGDRLVLTVRDTGAGLAAAHPRPGGGFGLVQVRERLATRYGGAATFALADAAGGGTLATIELPVETPR